MRSSGLSFFSLAIFSALSLSACGDDGSESKPGATRIGGNLNANRSKAMDDVTRVGEWSNISASANAGSKIFFSPSEGNRPARVLVLKPEKGFDVMSVIVSCPRGTYLVSHGFTASEDFELPIASKEKVKPPIHEALVEICKTPKALPLRNGDIFWAVRTARQEGYAPVPAARKGEARPRSFIPEPRVKSAS